MKIWAQLNIRNIVKNYSVLQVRSWICGGPGSWFVLKWWWVVAQQNNIRCDRKYEWYFLVDYDAASSVVPLIKDNLVKHFGSDPSDPEPVNFVLLFYWKLAEDLMKKVSIDWLVSAARKVFNIDESAIMEYWCDDKSFQMYKFWNQYFIATLNF